MKGEEMYRSLLIASALLLSACAAHQNSAEKYDGQAPAEIFADTYTPQAFWLREYEIMNDKAGSDFSRSRMDYKLCVVDESTKDLPPDIRAAVDAFLRDKSIANYHAIINMVNIAGDELSKKYGEPPVEYADRVCRARLA